MKRFWLCRCGHRNERTQLKCRGEGCNRTRPKTRQAAHFRALDLSFEHYAELQLEVHGVDEQTCALCGKQAKSRRLDRDHAHFGEGYARGLLDPLCNKVLGEVERGRDAEQWLVAALAYVQRARAHHESEAAV